MHWDLEVIITVNVGVDNVHSERIGLILLEVLLVKHNIGVLFVLGDGDKVGEDIMLIRHVGAHFNRHIFIVS
jgi:hypothetical protein